MSRSKPIPAAIGTIFGGLWAFLAAMALPPVWHVPAAVIAAVATAVLVLRLWRVRTPSAVTRPRLFGRRAYQVAVAAEIVAIYAASVVLPRYGLQEYLVQVVGIIVGLHFIGLWAATRSRRFLGIAAGMSLLSALAIALPAAVHLVALRDVCTGVGNALVLWIGASRPD